MAKNFEIRPFGGLNTSLSPESLSPLYAQDCLNVFTADGAVRNRAGYRAIGSIPANFSACYGFNYAQGYNSSRAEKEQFLVIQTIGSNNYPYELVCDTSTGNTITNKQVKKAGAVSATFDAYDAHVFAHDQYAYWIIPGGGTPVWRSTLGGGADNNLTLTGLASPSAPASAPTLAITYGNASNPYTEKFWTGGSIAGTGSAYSAGSIQADGTARITVTAATTGTIVATIDMGSNQDWSYYDIYALRLSWDATGGAKITPKTVTFTNADGSPLTLAPDTIKWLSDDPVYPPSTTMCARLDFTKKTRTDHDNVRKVVITFEVTQALSSTFYVYVSQMILGGMHTMSLSEDPGSFYTFRCAYYNSTLGLPAGMSPLSAGTRVRKDDVSGYAPWPVAGNLGARFTLTAPTTADGAVTHAYFYILSAGGEPVQVGNMQLGSSAIPSYTYTLDVNRYGIRATNVRHSAGDTLTGMVGGIPFKSWFVWLKSGGTQNIRHSAMPGSDGVPRPTKLYATTDDFTDPTRGADFSLADNFSDEPLCGFDADDSLIILGRNGCYAQTATTGLFADDSGFQSVGWTPSTLSPCRRLPGSRGCAGRFAACRYITDSGETGVAYLDRDGNIWAADVNQGFNGESGYKLVEISREIRGYVKSFLLTAQASEFSLTDFSTARMGYDEQEDALFLFMGARALVLRRPSQIDGARHWEPYEYETGGTGVSVRFLGFSAKRQLRAILSTGQMVEFERNTASSNIKIETTLRDGGYQMPSAYWTSKTFLTSALRLLFTRLDRDSLTDTPSLTVYSDRTTAGEAKTCKSGTDLLKWHFTNMGRKWKFKVTLPTNMTGAVRSFTSEFTPCNFQSVPRGNGSLQLGVNIETSPTYGTDVLQTRLLELAPKYVRLVLPQARPHVDLALIQWISNILGATPILTTKLSPKDSFSHTLANLRLMRDGDTSDADMDYREGPLPDGCIIECPNEYDHDSHTAGTYTTLLTQCALIRDFCLEAESVAKGFRFLGPSLVDHTSGSPYAQFVSALGSNTGNLHTYNVPSDAGSWVYDLAQKAYFEAVYSIPTAIVTEFGASSATYDQGDTIPAQIDALASSGYTVACLYNLSTGTGNNGVLDATTGAPKNSADWELIKAAFAARNL